MTFIHYSKDPIGILDNRNYLLDERINFKPIGLWFSVKGDDDWEEWCKAESFRLENLRLKYIFDINNQARVLLLTTAQEIDEFTEKYKIPDIISKINWPLVEQHYDAIIITPYCWERRLSIHTIWYYSWDCASGCIWNVNMVENWRQLHDEEGQAK